MAMRMTGINSGLDTESIIQELVAARRVKVDKIKKEQTSLEWKQEIWKELNTKIRKLFDGTLSNLQYQSSYMKKTTSVSNSNLVSILTSDSAMDSVQSLEINKMAKAGYLTGGVMKAEDGNGPLSSGSNVSRLGIDVGSKFEVNVGGKVTDITIDESTTISSLVSQLQSAGVKASFDATNQRLFIGSDGTGDKKDFAILASNADGTDALNKLGILVYGDDSADGSNKIKDAYQKYANLATDTTARQAAIQSRADALLKAYTAEKKSLKESNENIAKAYEESSYFKADDPNSLNITDDTARGNRITTLNNDVTRLTEELKDTNLSVEVRAEKESELNKAKGELSYLDAYEKNAKRLKEIDTKYLKEDGTAKADVNAEAEAYVQGKVAEAVNIINKYNAGTLQGSEGAHKIAGQDAEIVLNGATFTSDSNTVAVNGLTITCKGETNGEKITLTTESDTSGIYDMIKGFIKEYGELINEMDKLYNAESARGYEPLTDDEKDAMSEKEVEKWEAKIKDSLLRRDSTLSTVSSAMKEIMASGFSVNGKTMYLSDFGIETLGYFNAADNEKNAYHINGDEDDAAVKSKENDLMEMIRTDPDAVVSFFTQLSQSLHGRLNDLMKGTAYSSSFTVYDDKKMKEDYESYKTKISEAEKKLQEYEDKWYKKFSAMETALAKMQSNASAITSLLGGS